MPSFGEIISQSSTVLLYADILSSFDKASAVIGLIRFLRKAEKKTDLLLSQDPEKEIKDLLAKHEIEYIKELKPRNYTITIKYGESGIEKIVWDKDEKNKKLVFQIVPGEETFNFDDVEFSQGGMKYDLTISIGTSDPKEIFTGENEYLVRENKTVLISREKKMKEDLYIPVQADGAFCEAVYDLLQNTGADFDKETVEILLNGTINHRKVLEGNASSNSWNLISSMIGQGADFNKLLSDNYFSKSQENLDAQIELMRNIRKDPKSRVIWSIVDNEKLKRARINEKSLDVRGRIPFNISTDFDLAFAVYEIGEKVLRVVIESNTTEKYSASVIAAVFDGQGGEAHAECVVKGFSAQEFESRVFPILKDLYGIEVELNLSKPSKNTVVMGKSIDKKPRK